jgi:signal transduction histidine kinase
VLRDAGVRSDWQLRLPPDGLALPPYTALQLLRVMQEALVNVLRHAEASRVEVGIGIDADCGELQLVVEDDGRGLDPGVGGRGVEAMQGRARALGGRFGFARPPAGGTRVTLRMPITPPAAASAT